MNKKYLYTEILIWAFERQDTGFKWIDLQKELNLSDVQLQWVLRVFSPGVPMSENLIGHLNDDTLTMTAKGTSAAVQYLNLKEAEKSGKRAERMAWVAIVIGIIVGASQILLEVSPTFKIFLYKILNFLYQLHNFLH